MKLTLTLLPLVIQVTDSSSQDTDETMLKCCTVTDQAKSTLVVQGTKQLPKCIENTEKTLVW